jgi:hypothetical protein
MDLTWTLSASADEANHDQETDLGPLGSPGGAVWATVAPDGRVGRKLWGWVIYSRWNDVDEGDDAVLAEGEADEEDEAKVAVADWVEDHLYVGAMTEYTFDLAAVITVHVSTAGGVDAARQAADSIETLVDGGVAGTDANPEADDVTFELTCVAPRGPAWLIDIDSDYGLSGEFPEPSSDGVTDGMMPEPILGVDLSAADIAAMHEALATLDDAATGDSNDAEIEAGHDCADHLARLLALLGHPYNASEETP